MAGLAVVVFLAMATPPASADVGGCLPGACAYAVCANNPLRVCVNALVAEVLVSCGGSTTSECAALDVFGTSAFLQVGSAPVPGAPGVYCPGGHAGFGVCVWFRILGVPTQVVQVNAIEGSRLACVHLGTSGICAV